MLRAPRVDVEDRQWLIATVAVPCWLAALLGSAAGCGTIGYDAATPDAQEDTEEPAQSLTFGENAFDDYNRVTDDTWLDPENPTLNYGASDYLDSISDNSVLIRFDLQAISPSAEVLSAELCFTPETAAIGGYSEIFPVLEPWTEGSQDERPGVPNWTQRTSASEWSEPGADGAGRATSPAGSFTELEVNQRECVAIDAAVVGGWVSQAASNFGLVFVSQGYDLVLHVHLWSSEVSDDTRRPSLRVSFREAK